MTAFTRSWDNTVPTDGEDAFDGAERIRHFRVDTKERMQVDHSFANDAHDGKHKQATMRASAAVPTLDTGDGALYMKDGELYFKDPAGNVVQLTGGGSSQGVPVGSVVQFSGAVLPAGYLWCDGSVISRTTYAVLFAAYGNTDIYGGGDGATTFGLPDLRGRVPVGKDDMNNSVGTGGGAASRVTAGGSGINGATLGAAGGAQTHTLITGELPAHTHTGTTGNDSPDHTHSYNQTAGAAGAVLESGGEYTGPTAGTTGGASARHTHTFTTDAAGSGSAHNNMPPTLILNQIVRYV